MSLLFGLLTIAIIFVFVLLMCYIFNINSIPFVNCKEIIDDARNENKEPSVLDEMNNT